MDYGGSANIIFTTMARHVGAATVYRVIERISDGTRTYSLFVSTLTGGALEESFASDLTIDADVCVRLCNYLKDMLVTASSLADVISDNVGLCDGAPPVFDEL